MESHACADTSVDHVLDAKHGLGGIALAPSRFIGKLTKVFGRRFTNYLGLVYFGLKGVAFSNLTSAMLPYFQLMQVSGVTFQLASVVARIPWSMKGFVGVLSDCFPLGRYHKRGYLIPASIIGAVAFTILGSLPVKDLGPSRVWPVAVLFCMANILIATFDLLCEGKYSELMRQESAGSEVLTLVWTCMQSGALVSALVTGATIDTWGPQPMLWVCVPLAILACWRTCAGDLPEAPARSRASLRAKVRSEPGLFVLAGLMAGGGLLVAIGVTFLGMVARAALAIGISGFLIIISFRTLPKTLARSNLYMFLASVAYMDVTGPLSYFYTGTDQCIVDGPHFSYAYYLSVSNVVGAVGSIMGAIIFQYMQSWSFRGAFCVTACIQIFASVFDLMIVYRVNIRWGLSDEATYLFGDAACQSTAQMMATMPMAMLTARLCPRGAEATVFAILAGFQNFGSSVGSILGVLLSEGLEVTASAAGPCDFDRLGVLIILAHCIGPLFVLPFTYCLVPAARIDDEVAFEAAPPPPSFRSPPASPLASPAPSSACSSDGSPSVNMAAPGGEYCLMEDLMEDDPSSTCFKKQCSF
mmetsp:Transcript_99849/g.279624  ORF Transcript_99849/g.279624 Transcript_99849/m.279624 type:complete len:584 (+) Transcript_99849:131-1882(+)